MSLIENHILETQKKVNLLFDALLEKVRGNVEFLDEMNATNAEYDVAYVATPPETPCDIPAPEDLPEQVNEKLATKEVLIEKFGLEEIAQSIDPKIWESLVKTFVIAGWNMRMLLDSNWWKKQTITLTTKEAERLDELSLLRDQMILKEMDLAQVQGQNGMTEIEKLAFAELAKKENLK